MTLFRFQARNRVMTPLTHKVMQQAITGVVQQLVPGAIYKLSRQRKGKPIYRAVDEVVKMPNGNIVINYEWEDDGDRGAWYGPLESREDYFIEMLKIHKPKEEKK